MQGMEGQLIHNGFLAASAKVNLWRLDLPMNIEGVRLDDINALAVLQQCAVKSLSSDRDFQKLMKEAAWALIASLFYFEFEEEPRPDMMWKGMISCRYPHIPELKQTLNLRFADTAVFVVGDTTVRFQSPCKVAFHLAEPTRDFDVRLRCHDRDASISGFPDTALNLYGCQVTSSQGQTALNSFMHQSDAKRKLTEENCPQFASSKPKRLRLRYR